MKTKNKPQPKLEQSIEIKPNRKGFFSFFLINVNVTVDFICRIHITSTRANTFINLNPAKESSA